MSEVCTPNATPAELFRQTIEGAGFTVSSLPADLTWDGVGSIVREVLRKSTRANSPEVGQLLDSGDVNGAAKAFMAELDSAR